jgi:hypothetical protein
MIFHFRNVVCAAGVVCAVTLAPLTAIADARANLISNTQANDVSRADMHVASGGLNLLSSAKPGSKAKSRKRVAVGNGSYICSPAGFGQRSRCYSN